MMIKDYVFEVKWNEYVVGILAQIEKEYYLVFKDKEDIEKECIEKGYLGIPGFNVEEVYKSRELFDFFKTRILETAQSNACEELAKTRGVSMVDSFTVDPVPEKMISRYKQKVLDAYDIQMQLKECRKASETKNNDEKTNSDVLPSNR